MKNRRNEEIINQRRQNLKNVYNHIKRNIKTTFSQNKQKNKLKNIASKKLTENIDKKSDSDNRNSNYIKKAEESRNINKIKFNKNNDDEIFDAENDIFFNKTEKDIKLLYNKNYSKKILKGKIIPYIDIKRKETDKDLLNKKTNFFSTKEKNVKEDIKNQNHNNLLFHNKNIISNKEFNPMNITNKNKYIEKNETKKKQNSFENVPKLIINRKKMTKEKIIKTKNIFEKLHSARFVNNEIPKLNLNFNKEIKSDFKTISSKTTSRINSQKLADLKDKELNLGKIKKIKKNKVIKEITKYKKNHSMTMSDANKILILNDTLKGNIKMEKENSGIIKLYNYPNIRKNIPYHINYIMNSAGKENNETNIKNDLSNLNNTCLNLNDIRLNNSTINNNFNGTNNQNENKNGTPNKCHFHNNSFNQLYSQANFYSRPVTRLKKRIFDSPPDNKNDNSMNYKEKNYVLDISEFGRNDSLEINKKEINNNVIKELLIAIKALNQIIITQKKIIEEYMQKEIELKKEILNKDKAIKDYKNICFKLMFYLKEEKEFNILNEKNKRRYIIENQLIKENKILKEIFKLPIINTKKNCGNKDNFNFEDELDITINSFHKNSFNENGSTTNFYKINSQKKEEAKVVNGNNVIDPLYNLEIMNNQNINKKREKSYENRRKKILKNF